MSEFWHLTVNLTETPEDGTLHMPFTLEPEEYVPLLRRVQEQVGANIRFGWNEPKEPGTLALTVSTPTLEAWVTVASVLTEQLNPVRLVTDVDAMVMFSTFSRERLLNSMNHLSSRLGV